MFRGVLVCFVLIGGMFQVYSQIEVDTVDVDTMLEEFDIEIPDRSPKKDEIKSPALALTLSAIMPGAGQIYNGAYWKPPIILGVAGYFTYAIVVLHDYYTDYRQRYRDSLINGDVTERQRDWLRSARDFYRDQRDRFAWYMGFLYLINLLDAYVEATLSGFDVGEDLTFRMTPYVKSNGSAGLSIQLRF